MSQIEAGLRTDSVFYEKAGRQLRTEPKAVMQPVTPPSKFFLACLLRTCDTQNYFACHFAFSSSLVLLSWDCKKVCRGREC